MAASDVSEGEIVGDLSEISSAEDDYFENLKKLTSRKLELELLDAFGQFGEFAFFYDLQSMTFNSTRRLKLIMGKRIITQIIDNDLHQNKKD